MKRRGQDAAGSPPATVVAQGVAVLPLAVIWSARRALQSGWSGRTG